MSSVTAGGRQSIYEGQVLALDWSRIADDLDSHGCAVVQGLLSAEDCSSLAKRYASDDLFRSRVVMTRYGFGRGEYKYFTYIASICGTV